MEELRSTEILDKEIQSDARKKAERILSNADVESQTVMAAVAGRIEVITKEKTAVYNQKIAQFQKNSDASLPLEKQRFAVSYVGTSVIEAISAYLLALTPEKRLALISKMFDKSKNIIANKKMKATVYGSDSKAAEQMIKKLMGTNLLSCTETEFEKTGEIPVKNLTVHEGIILESEDHFIRCRFTLEELVSEIQDTYSYELASTLFGGRLPE